MSQSEGRARRPRTRHEGLKAWQSAQALTLELYRVTRNWPADERYGLIAQVRRSAVSVSANIAEGSAKRGSKEFRRFLDISLGSIAEIHVYLVLAKELSYLTPAEWGELEALRDHTGKLIWGLSRAIQVIPTEVPLASGDST